MSVDACVVCGGRLKWFPEVHAWRHIWVPDGTLPHLAVRQERPTEERELDDVAPATIGAAGYIADIVESDVDTGQRIVETREQIEARGRAMREAMGDSWDGYVRPVITITPPAPVLDPEKLVEHPKPEVLPRPAAGEEMPKAALQVRTLLQDNDWSDIEQVYFRGSKPDRYQRIAYTKVVDVVVVRARRPEMSEVVVASWEDGKYDEGYWRVPGDTVALSSTELKAKIRVPVMTCDLCHQGPYTHKECTP